MTLGEVVAEITYADDVDKFHGLVVSGPGFRQGDMVEFYGSSPEELRQECEVSMQFHRELLERHGLEPESEKSYSGTIFVRADEETHRAAAEAAERAGQSLNAWALEAIKSALR